MSRRTVVSLLAGSAILAGSLYAWQREWREYPGWEYSDFAVPDDYKVPAEWVFARLMYPSAPTATFVRGDPRNWAKGNTSWTQDYPRGPAFLDRTSPADARGRSLGGAAGESGR